ncbi:MAG: hypothetical protein GY754_25145 [bacterium]|nr:hypothetical protein [bacterium]
MKNMKKYRFIVIFLLSLVLCSTSGNSDPWKLVQQTPHKKIQLLSFDPSSPVISRIASCPNDLLKLWKKLDKRDNYSPYTPSRNEIKIIQEALNKLPRLHKKVLKERLIGIYFINNFHGSGVTDWTINSDNRIYTYIIINPSVLTKDFSTLVTQKDKTCFNINDPSIDISINCGKKYSGFLYILLHESTHAVDYVVNITPYVEPDMVKYNKNAPQKTPFTKWIWDTYKKPETAYPFRTDVTFYGFNKGPRVNIVRALDMYSSLSRSPFVSLYGSLNWAEDLAEFVTYYHLTQKLGEKYVISVKKNNKVLFSYEPMKSAAVKERFSTMKRFY